MTDDLVTRLRTSADEWENNEMPVTAALLAEAADEIDRLLEPSWSRLMEILDEHYPAEVCDGSSGDPGPTIIVLTREIDRLRDLTDPWTHPELAILDVCKGLDADTVEHALEWCKWKGERVLDYAEGQLGLTRSSLEPNPLADWRPRSKR